LPFFLFLKNHRQPTSGHCHDSVRPSLSTPPPFSNSSLSYL
jgi:hypothetical protein